MSSARKNHVNSRTVLHLAAALAVVATAIPLLAAAPGPAAPPAAAAPAPAAETPAVPGQPAAPAAPDGGARRGGRGGGGGRGGAMTPEELAMIAKVNSFPAWKPGVGDGDYVMTPPHNPAPENVARE